MMTKTQQIMISAVLWLLTAHSASLFAAVQIGSPNPDIQPQIQTQVIPFTGSSSFISDVNDAGAELTRFTVSFHNQSQQKQTLEGISLTFGDAIKPITDPGGGYGSSIYANRDSFHSHQTEVTFNLSRPSIVINDWFGWQNRYQLEAIRPVSQNWSASADAEIAQDELILRTSLTLEAGETHVLVFEHYFGSRDKAVLEDLGLDQLVLKNLWSWFRLLCEIIWSLLAFLFSMTEDWGFSIILLALIVRLVILPITAKSLAFQTKAIEQQQRINPKVAEIKTNYSGVELSEQMIELYESERYDHWLPFKGMLGLFIQIPILIALFTVIGDMSALQGQQFLWIADLSLSDRLLPIGADLPFFGSYFNLLPFLMAATTVGSTWLAARSSQGDTPATSLFGMAIVFFVFFYSFPAALVLYWFSSNFFQLIQQGFKSFKEGSDER
jgi:YidC/Oxa1 family membrane protein insertase